MKVTSKINQSNIKVMKGIFESAQVKTCDGLKSDLQDSQTLPFDTGALQENIMVDKDKVKQGIVLIVHTNLPYPRRLYYHPEYNFRKDKNSNAGGLWFEPYLKGGSKEKMATMLFASHVKKEMQNVIKRH